MLTVKPKGWFLLATESTLWKLEIGVLSSTKSGSEELERFHFLPIPTMTPTLIKIRLSESKAKAEKPIKQIASSQALSLEFSVYDSDKSKES